MYRVWEREDYTRVEHLVQFNMYFSVKRLQDLVPGFIAGWINKYRLIVIQKFEEASGRAEALT